jgi:hypothetical protein
MRAERFDCQSYRLYRLLYNKAEGFKAIVNQAEMKVACFKALP